MSKFSWRDVDGAIVLECMINFRSTGWYDPGRRGGRPEDGYPPEGEDERTLESVEINGKTLDAETARKIFDLFQADVDEAYIVAPDEPC